MAIRITHVICDNITDAIALIGSLNAKDAEKFATVTLRADTAALSDAINKAVEEISEVTGAGPGEAMVGGEKAEIIDDSKAGETGGDPALEPKAGDTPAQIAIKAGLAAAAAGAAAKKEGSKRAPKALKAEPAPAPTPAPAPAAEVQAAPIPAEKPEEPAPTPPTAMMDPAPVASSSGEGDFFASTDPIADAVVEKTYTIEQLETAMKEWTTLVPKSTFDAVMAECGVKSWSELKGKQEVWSKIMGTIEASTKEIKAVAAKAAESNA